MTRVAIQGVTGSYSEEAVRVLFGSDAAIVECVDFLETFEAVRLGKADRAVVPVENKIVGQIPQTVQLLGTGGYKIFEKLPLKVRHVLVGTLDAQFDDFVSVRSHVEALRQCQTFLGAYPSLTQVIGADTASSVRRIVNDGDPRRAAIGSRRAAELYGAKVLRENIADDIDNWTVFYLIGN